MNRAEYEKQLIAKADSAFEHHTVVETNGDGDRWYMHRQDDGHFWVEIVALRSGAIMVHGDISSTVFARCSYTDPRSMIAWMGGQYSDYVLEKATIGTGREVTHTFRRDVAIDDFEELKETYMDDASEPYSPEIEAAFSDAIECLRHNNDSWDSIVGDLYMADADIEGEDLAGVGYVVAPRVIYANAALRRLNHLLEAKDQAERIKRPVLAGEVLIGEEGPECESAICYSFEELKEQFGLKAKAE